MYEINVGIDELLLIVGEQQGYRYKITQHRSEDRYFLYIWNRLYCECDTLLGIENRLALLKMGDMCHANDGSSKASHKKVSV